MGFKENLKEAMYCKNITTAELATITNINSGTLSSYLKTNGSMPPADKALKIARALDVSIDFLVEGFNVKADNDEQKNIQIPIEVYKLACDLSSLSKDELNAIKCVLKVLERNQSK
ncbi:MAG: helix-turn-helix transcriptional regulator [Spirochaetaceae bacterium]|nr:helix-turn-helix transcriptional regulator [Spirochaetaceae bacterium]